MGKKLFIVESPAKAKTIQKYLGSSYLVMASMGHVRDLPDRKMGVDDQTYKITYEIKKAGVVKSLRSASKGAPNVYLAMDPDREGEAIAWHLAELLNLRDPKRVTYTEINERAIKEAIGKARKIDMGLVRAQEARRVVDRRVGYRVSPVLSRLAGKPLSAGRVQTPALILVVDREREIEKFISTTHYGVEAIFKDFSAEWDAGPYLLGDNKYLLDIGLAQRVADQAKDFEVTGVDAKPKAKGAPAPFITASLQQTAANSLGFTAKETMQIAQRLYEGVDGHGLITYMRTDSPAMSNSAIAEVRSWLSTNGMGDCIPENPIKRSPKGDAQGAHECIRPSDINNVKPVGLSQKEQQLYTVIWKRAVASQMAPAIYDTTIVSMLTTESIEGARQRFLAKGSVLRFDGWRRMYEAASDEKSENDKHLPHLTPGELHAAISTKLLTKKTQPPPRYTEASLIKKLKDEGVGRPSTYAAIIETIKKRQYVRVEKKQFIPTSVGLAAYDILVGRFGFADVGYTRKVEENFDAIADSKSDFFEVVKNIDQGLTEEIGKLDTPPNQGAAGPPPPCPNNSCSGHLARKPGKNGLFWGCSNYPSCNETRPDDNGQPGKRGASHNAGDTRYPCPQCDKFLALRGKEKSHFWGCTGYPDCSQAFPNYRGKPAIFKCPKCDDNFLARFKAKKGPNKGKPFWVCRSQSCGFFVNDNRGRPVEVSK